MSSNCPIKCNKLFENILYITNTAYVNNIEALTEDGSVNIDGYVSEDELIVVNVNCSELIFNANPTFYCYVADRSIEVVSVDEIHSNGGQVGSAVSLQKRLLDLSAVNIINPNLSIDGADNVSQSGTLVGANVGLVKGEALFISAVGNITNLEGCVVSITLRIPA